MPHPKSIARYEVLGLLGAGGMGAVYQARDPHIGGRLLAIKLLRRDHYTTDDAIHELAARIVHEARAAGQIRSDHVVQIFDVGEHEGEPYIAMEFIDGDTLAAIIKRREPLTLGRKLDLMLQLCEGASAAHQCGIVHRDIKPPNLFVERKGRLKILDFGIAKMADSGMHTLTGALIGTANYASPEQVMGRSTLDKRSDIFSIGAVFYELLCYRQAFPGPMPGVMHKILHEWPETLASIGVPADAGLDVAAIEAELSRIVWQAMAKDPDERYQNLQDVTADVEEIYRQLPTESPRSDSRRSILTSTAITDNALTPAPLPPSPPEAAGEPQLAVSSTPEDQPVAASTLSLSEFVAGAAPPIQTTSRPLIDGVSEEQIAIADSDAADSAPITLDDHSVVTNIAAVRPAATTLRNRALVWLAVLGVLAAVIAGGFRFVHPITPHTLLWWSYQNLLGRDEYIEAYSIGSGAIIAQRWALGETDLWQSTDSGQTWKAVEFPAGFRASSVAHNLAGVEVYGAGPNSAPTILTPDVRNVWRAVTLPADQTFSIGTAVAIENVLFVRDHSGSLYKSSEGNWALVNGVIRFDSGPGSIIRGARVGESLVLVTDQQFISSDGGVDWHRFRLPTPDANAQDGLILRGAASGFELLLVAQGQLWTRHFEIDRSGINAVGEWKIVPLGGSDSAVGLRVAGADRPGLVWAYGNNALWRSRDYAASWTKLGPVSANETYVVSFAADADAAYVGIQGGILTARDDGRSWSCHSFGWLACWQWTPPDE